MTDSAKSVVMDVLYVRRFITLLLKDFSEWDAAHLGIIDDNGNILKKRVERKSGEEKKAFTKFHKIVLTIKKTLNKISSNKVVSIVTAMTLLKEHCEEENIDFLLIESHFMVFLKEEYDIDYKLLIEDGAIVPTNNTTGLTTVPVIKPKNINTFRRKSSLITTKKRKKLKKKKVQE